MPRQKHVSRDVSRKSSAKKVARKDGRKTEKQICTKEKVPRERHLKTVEEIDARKPTEQDSPKKVPKKRPAEKAAYVDERKTERPFFF